MEAALPIALDASVTLRILHYQEQGGPTTEDWLRAQEFGPVLAEHGDTLLYGGGKKSGKSGEAARLFNSLADAIATLAFCPGGITIFGRHWEGKC